MDLRQTTVIIVMNYPVPLKVQKILSTQLNIGFLRISLLFGVGISVKYVNAITNSPHDIGNTGSYIQENSQHLHAKTLAFGKIMIIYSWNT
jgi:hypothetical protein